MILVDTFKISRKNVEDPVALSVNWTVGLATFFYFLRSVLYQDAIFYFTKTLTLGMPYIFFFLLKRFLLLSII